MKNLLMTKSNDLMSETFRGHTSRPCNKTGKHFNLVVDFFMPIKVNKDDECCKLICIDI